MVFESLAIVLILLLMSMLFLRRKQKGYALATLPLVVLPVMHVLSIYFSKILTSLSFDIVVISGDILALAISGILLGVVSQYMKTQKTKLAYLIACGVFILGLAWVYISNIIK